MSNIKCPECGVKYNEKTHKCEYKINCPLCREPLPYTHIEKKKGDINATHIWVCDECPFIGFEYWQDNNLKELTDFINK